MEIIKPRKDLLFIVGPAFVLVAFLFFLFFMDFIPALFYGHWIFLLSTLALCIFPFSKKKFGEVRHFSPLPWLGLIFLMQISLFALHLGLFQVSYAQELVHFGLFPWGWVAILASSFAAVAYWRKENAFGNALLFPLIKSSVDTPLGLIINNVLKSCQNMTLITTFSLAIILVAGLFGSHFISPYSGALPLFAILFLILLTFTKSYQRFLSKISPYPAWLLAIVFVLVFALLLSVLHAISAGMNFSLSLPHFLSRFQTYPSALLENILSLSWWLGSSILVSLFVAQISAGYSRRALIGAVLILPILIVFFSETFPSFQMESLSVSTRGILGLMGFIVMAILFMHKRMFSPFVLSYLPKNGENKYRNPEFLIRKLIQLTLIFLYIYLPVGVFFSAGFMFLAVFFIFIFAGLLLIAVFRALSFRA